MTVYRFVEVKHTARKTGVCTGFGKRRSRQRTFWQTINPFNKNAEGVPKTGREIYAELRIEGDAWASEPMRCAACEQMDHLEALAKQRADRERGVTP